MTVNIQAKGEASYAIPDGQSYVHNPIRWSCCDNAQQKEDGSHISKINRSLRSRRILIRTSQGLLQIRGEELRIVHLDVDKGLLTLEGTVATIQYDEEEAGSRNFLHKLFGWVYPFSFLVYLQWLGQVLLPGHSWIWLGLELRMPERSHSLEGVRYGLRSLAGLLSDAGHFMSFFLFGTGHGECMTRLRRLVDCYCMLVYFISHAVCSGESSWWFSSNRYGSLFGWLCRLSSKSFVW